MKKTGRHMTADEKSRERASVRTIPSGEYSNMIPLLISASLSVSRVFPAAPLRPFVLPLFSMDLKTPKHVSPGPVASQKSRSFENMYHNLF
jgi:hypothetical protein